MRLQGIAIALTAVLAFGAVPVRAEIVALIDSFELDEGIDLTGWNVNVVAAPGGPATAFCGYEAQMAIVTAIEPAGIQWVTRRVWLVDTSGAAIAPAQRLDVSLVSDCPDAPGIWMLTLTPLGSS